MQVHMSKDAIPVKVILFVLFLAMLWGGNTVALKIGFQEFMPLASAGLRFSVAALLIIVWAYANRISLWPKPHERFSLFLIGLLFTLQIICFNWGTDLTRAGRAAVMIHTYPLFIAFIAHFLVPGDRLRFWKSVGLIVAFGGIVMVFLDNLSGGFRGYLIGDLLILSSGLQLALLIVLTKRLVQHIDPYRLLASQMIVGIPVFFGLSMVFEGRAGFGFSYPALFAILYQGIVVGGFCFVGWTLVLKHYLLSRMSVLFFTTPLWGITLSYLLLAEPLTLGLGIGAVFVALGIYIVNQAPV
jgi:drug/metabolite transporter (DMT)-like permease